MTSRNHLTGLVATEGAYPLTLDLLTAAGAGHLLTLRLGASRVESEPAAVRDIITACARLPLALTIVAARAAVYPSFPLAAFASELHEATRTLDPLSGGDLASDVRAVFSCSYRALSADAARLFRLLGLQAGPDIALAGAASLAAIPADRARGLLSELARVHLIAEHAPGRYACHDLLRAYATEQAHTHDSQDVRDAAVGRVLDHYLHTAHSAAMLLQPHLHPIALDPPQPGVTPAAAATAEGALGWFTAEHANLLAAVRLAAGAGFGTRAWQLAWTLTTFLLRRGRWSDQAMVWNAGLAAARRAGDTAGQAHALHGLAIGYARAGRLREASPLFLDALQRFETIGDQVSQATIHNGLSVLAERQQRPADMLSHSLRALDLYRAADHWAGQVWVRNNIGYSHALLGNYQQAISYCQRALAGLQELGERCWEAATWHSLGYIRHQLGHHQQAVSCYQRSLDICQELADRYNEADTLDHLGNVHYSAGDTDAARRTWTLALHIFDEIGHPDRDRVRAKLRRRGLTGFRPSASGWPGPLADPASRQPAGRAGLAQIGTSDKVS